MPSLVFLNPVCVNLSPGLNLPADNGLLGGGRAGFQQIHEHCKQNERKEKYKLCLEEHLAFARSRIIHVFDTVHEILVTCV